MPQQPRLSDALGHAPADRRIDILRAVAATGSISQAARDVGVSYKAAWQALDTLTNLAGVPLVERAVGGAGGGGAVVTAAGLELLALADALQAARSRVLAGGVDAAGAIGLRTSMRNQWRCEVLRLERAGPLVRVHLHPGGGTGDGDDARRLVARVTRESAELLALRAGQPVLALCKATAVEVSPGGTADPGGAPNRFEGVVTRIARDASGSEVSLQVAPALHVVGFIRLGAPVRVRGRATAILAETALVVALAH